MNKLILFFNRAIKLGVLAYPFSILISKLSPSGMRLKKTIIRRYLHSTYMSFLKEDVKKTYTYKEENADEIIWVYWKQGIENAPDIVRICINSMYKNIDGVKIMLLSDANLYEFISIEKHILAAVERGSITPTHFSDIVRTKLLKKYGGLWLDSTIFVPNKVSFSEIVYNSQGIFTITEKSRDDSIFIPNGRWTGFCFGVNKKNSAIFRTLDELFTTYWEKENHLIDYFLIDYFLEMLYQHLALEVNNINKHGETLFSIINEKFDETLYNEYSKNVTFHKFSYKVPLIENIGNELTLWGYLKSQYLDMKD